VRPNIFFLPGLIETSYGFDRAGGDQPLLAIIVHAFNERLETLVHEMALDLARRGHRLALFLGIERLGQDAKVLDLLDAGKLAVRPLDLGADQSHHVGARGEAGEAGVGHVVTAGPIRYRVGLDLDEGGKVFAAMAEDDRLRDIGAGAQDVLDERRRDRLAAGGDDEIARAVDEPQRAGVPFADVAGAQSAVRALDRAGCLRVVPIALEEIGTLHQHFAIACKLDDTRWQDAALTDSLVKSLTSQPAGTVPTSPGRGNGPRWPQMMPPAVSVCPYISTTLTPSIC